MFMEDRDMTANTTANTSIKFQTTQWLTSEEQAKLKDLILLGALARLKCSELSDEEIAVLTKVYRAWA